MIPMMIPTCVLVDARNWRHIKAPLLAEMAAANMVGVDIETNDARRHAGLNRAMKVDPEGFKGGNTKLLFDTNRTDITGFSVYAKGSSHAFYINLLHADIENRLPWEEAKQILDAIPKEGAYRLAHNAPFELTMMRKSLGYDLGKNIICTMQLAVTAFNDDTYDVHEFTEAGLGEIPKLFGVVQREFVHYQPRDVLTNEQQELLQKVVAKESLAAHSYVGFIKTMTYGYGLKRLVKRFLGYEQVTFEEVLGDKAHMGQLTGDEVASYGADDAWVCVYLYDALMAYLMKENPAVIGTFFTQENPMAQVYSQVWGGGVKINLPAVLSRREVERGKVCATLRTMKRAINALLPFDPEPHEKLVKYDTKLYKPEKYRGDVVRWAELPDTEDDFEQLYQIKSALSKQWAEDLGRKEPKLSISINYYQVIRCILLDLCHCSFQLSQGKIQSDGDARTVMEERHIKKAVDAGLIDVKKVRIEGSDDVDYARFANILTVLECYKQLAESEQVIKLFINTYLNLTDPDTGRVYPSLSSKLASRRMALQTPNLSQLPKFGGSAYVRSFFLPDEDDHVILSVDWSGVELVLIAEESKDPEMLDIFGSLPHGDMHSLTASQLLGITLEELKSRPDAKQQRNEIGKLSNFGYFYSGGLGTVAKALSLSSAEMWEFVDKFRTTYSGAEQWRLGTIQSAKEYGYVTLPDKHTRVRFESTYTWANVMRSKFSAYGETVSKFGELVIKKLATRSGNQSVNSKIQGTCATLAKRSILKMEQVIVEKSYSARFMYPVHDELVYSVKRTQVWEFMNDLLEVMCTHPDLVKNVKLDASAAIGLNYQSYSEKTNPKGQIELMELSKLACIDKERWGQKATKEEVETVLDYLFEAI